MFFNIFTLFCFKPNTRWLILPQGGRLKEGMVLRNIRCYGWDMMQSVPMLNPMFYK